MATGDSNDIVARLKSGLARWFGNGDTPVLDAVLTGLAAAWTTMYQLWVYAQQQTRIATATGQWLDLVAADFFGNGLPRNAGELDASYRARIRAALLQEKGTRRAVYNALLLLTGRAPRIIAPMRPADTGSYSQGGAGYGAAGAYGSLSMPYQAFVVAYRPASAGIPLVAGYGVPAGGYSTPSRASLASLADIQQAVKDADIFAAVDAAKPAGAQVWMQLQN